MKFKHVCVFFFLSLFGKGSAEHTAVSIEHTHHEHTPGAVGSTWGAVEGSMPCSRISALGYKSDSLSKLIQTMRVLSVLPPRDGCVGNL